jgi:hypothetical protein
VPSLKAAPSALAWRPGNTTSYRTGGNCLVYERLGSLLPVIAMHAANNAVAFGVQGDSRTGVALAAGLGTLTVAAWLLVAPPALARRDASATGCSHRRPVMPS